MINIQSATIISVCIIIMAVFGGLQDSAKSMGMTVFELCFATVIMLVLYGFTLSPVPELNVSAAAFCLPAYFMIISVSKSESEKAGGFAFIILWGTVMGILYGMLQNEYKPAVLGAVAAISGITFKKSSAFALMTAALLPLVAVSFAALFDLLLTSYASCDLASRQIMDAQSFACLFTGAVLTFLNKSKVINA